jgi:predicted RNase H-like nuclease (RuvC/YqgF family)
MSGSLPIFFGYALIVAATLGAFALLRLKHSKTTSGISFCLALATIGFACSYLPYLQKIQIGIIKIEMIDSAPHVMALEKEAAALGREVNQKREEVSALSKRSEELQKSNSASQELITRLNQQQQLMILRLQALIGKDRDAFDEIEKLSNDKSYLENEMARSYLNEVIRTIASEQNDDISGIWGQGLEKMDLVELEKRYSAAPDEIDGQFTKMAIIQTVDERAEISKKDKLQFFQKRIEQKKNLEVSVSAGRHFIHLAVLGFSPFARREILDWWKENADKVK